MNKIFLTALCGALFGLTAAAPMIAVPAGAQSVASEQSVTFAVDNMTCALCLRALPDHGEARDGRRRGRSYG